MPTQAPQQPANAWRADQTLMTARVGLDIAKIVLNVGTGNPVGVANAAIPLVQHYSEITALNSADWYDSTRVSAGWDDAFIAELADPPPDDKIAASVNWALTGDDPDAALTRVQGATQKLVTDAGRDTIQTAIFDDPVAIGFARHAAPGACYFCALLATRGATYKTLKTAGEDNPYHDHCHCVPVPIFRGERYKPDPHIKDWEKLYKESTGPYSGTDKIRAFRRALETNSSPDAG